MAVMAAPAKRGRRKNRAERRAEQGKGRRVGLSAEEVAGRKNYQRGMDSEGRRLAPYVYPRDGQRGQPQIRTFAASEPWIDVQFPTFSDVGPEGERVSYYFFDPRALPAGQLRCRTCGHLTTPNCCSARGVCLDCQYGSMSPGQLEMLPSSSSSVSIARLKRSRRNREEISPSGM